MLNIILTIRVKIINSFFISLVNQVSDDEDGNGNESVADFMTICSDLLQQLLLSLNARNLGEVITQESEDGIPET